MKTQTQHVLQKLFSEDSIENVSEDHLRQLVKDHPYFTLGHLLLAQKLQTLNAAEYEAQSEKTCLYFSEPIWLQTLLHPAGEQKFTLRQRTEPNEEGQPAVDEETVQQVEYVHAEQDARQENGLTESVIEESNSATVGEQSPQQEALPEESAPIFEPYHTVDYFASQGIRVSHEIRPDDRLGHQLRSFTEWLKTMKRLPETKVEEQLDEVSQQNIQEFAAHSLDEKEVVTETMAEVLIKQNKRNEAVAIYEKLSLLDPSKRAYFAAKIEQLKGL